MVRSKKRKSDGGVANTGAGTPNVSPKKMNIHSESPKQPKNRPTITPIKHSGLKSPSNTKPSPEEEITQSNQKPHVKLLPDDLVAQLSRRQKRRMVAKVAEKLKLKGVEDFSEIDPNDASIRQICKTIIEKDNIKQKETLAAKNKAKVMKKAADFEEAESSDSESD